MDVPEWGGRGAEAIDCGSTACEASLTFPSGMKSAHPSIVDRNLCFCKATHSECDRRR